MAVKKLNQSQSQPVAISTEPTALESVELSPHRDPLEQYKDRLPLMLIQAALKTSKLSEAVAAIKLAVEIDTGWRSTPPDTSKDLRGELIVQGVPVDDLPTSTLKFLEGVHQAIVHGEFQGERLTLKGYSDAVGFLKGVVQGYTQTSPTKKPRFNPPSP